MTSPFINTPAGNAPQPQTVNMILKSLGAAPDVGGGDTPPTQLGYTPLSNSGYYIPTGDDSEQPYVGETAPDRSAWISANVPLTSQQIRFTYITARKSEIINTLSTFTGATAAGATPTLCRVGVYSVDSKNGNLTLMAACANDTALWNAPNARFDKSLTTPWRKQAGTRYALACLCVSVAALPVLQGGGSGSTTTVISDLMNLEPRLVAALSGQADLPASVASASLISSTPKPGFLALP